MDLTNASAIVTGGAGGFGSATVRRFARKGAKVVRWCNSGPAPGMPPPGPAGSAATAVSG